MDQNTYPTTVTDTTTDGAPAGYEFYGQRLDPSASAPVWHQPATAPVPAIHTPPTSQWATSPTQPWPPSLPVELRFPPDRRGIDNEDRDARETEEV